jgi:DNA-binding NarL/FixJ family response regulator
MAPPAVLVIDDDVFTRTTLSAALSGVGYRVVSSSSASEAINFSKQDEISVAILDLDLGPGPTGIDLAVALRRQSPNIGVIFLTSYSDPRLLNPTDTALPAGSRYITKSQLSDISQLARLIDQTFAHPLRTMFKAPKTETELSAHQIEVLRLIAAGYSTSQIATELKLSIKAVEGVISRINTSIGISETNSNKRVLLTNFYYQLIGKL